MEQSAIDWPGIRAAAVALNSVNAAAVQAGANLPLDEAERLRNRINKRGLREDWLGKARAVVLTRVPNAKPLSQPVQTGAESLAAALAADSDATKLGFSRAAAKVARHVATLEPEDLTEKDRSQAVRHWAGVASAVHTWEDKKGGNQQVLINNGILNM